MSNINQQVNFFLENRYKHSLGLWNIELDSLSEEYYQLSRFEAIVTLMFDFCKIKKISSNINRFKNVETLVIRGSELGDIAEYIPYFKKLKTLRISNSTVGNISKSLSNLKSIEELALNGIDWDHTYDNLIYLNKIESLYFSSTTLLEIPLFVFELKTLRSLSISGYVSVVSPNKLGQLQGSLLKPKHSGITFPNKFDQLKELKSLTLSDLKRYPVLFLN